eukprot:jgi/Galph1/3370/GphlegSOOS_G2034.1
MVYKINKHSTVSKKQLSFLASLVFIFSLFFLAKQQRRGTVDNLSLEPFCEQVEKQGAFSASLERVVLQPPVPLKRCHPPELKCLSGNRTLNKRDFEVYDVFMFSFEVDALEIRFHELDDLVDHFVIIESNVDHKGYPKPLLWKTLQHDSRFSPFRSKVIHIVREADITFSKANRSRNNVNWEFEVQTYEKALEFCRFLPHDAVVILGFVDEVVSRQALFEALYCGQHQYPLSFGIWFPFGNFERAFASDFPIGDHKFTYGYPSLRYASQCTSGSYREQFRRYILGGLHISNYCFHPFVILKEMTATDYGVDSEHMSRERCMEHLNICHAASMDRTVSIKEIPANDVPAIYIPWLIKCNPDRYPSLMLKRIKEHLYNFNICG